MNLHPDQMGHRHVTKDYIPTPEHLCDRHLRIWRQVVIGGSDREIAQRSGLAYGTVKKSLCELYRVLDINPGQTHTRRSRTLATLWGAGDHAPAPGRFQRRRKKESMTWEVGCFGIETTDQTNSPTQDGQPDENKYANCGEADLRSCLLYYGKGDYAPDTIKDWLFQQGTFGPTVISLNTHLMSALAHFGGIPSITQVPNGKQNGVDGLLDREYQALYPRIPVFELGYWIDDNGVIYDGKHKKADGTLVPEIDHWRLVYRMTDTSVLSMDPWRGITRKQTWAEHYALSKQLLVVPVVAPKDLA